LAGAPVQSGAAIDCLHLSGGVGGGAALMEELELSTRAYLDGKD